MRMFRAIFAVVLASQASCGAVDDVGRPPAVDRDGDDPPGSALHAGAMWDAGANSTPNADPNQNLDAAIPSSSTETPAPPGCTNVALVSSSPVHESANIAL